MAPVRLELTTNRLRGDCSTIELGRQKEFLNTNKNMERGRLELPTNGLKGHCSTIELPLQIAFGL